MNKTITMCATKAGKGYKVIVDGTWFYTSIEEMIKMLGGKTIACSFRTIPKKGLEP